MKNFGKINGKNMKVVFIEKNEFDYFNKTLELFNIAIQIDLPTKYYNAQTKQCHIHITTDFKFDINDYFLSLKLQILLNY